MASIVTVIGARPQFIKAATVSPRLAEHGMRELLIHTGQHFDANMSDIFFGELDIAEPSINLGIGGGSHGQNTGRMIEAIERVLTAERPDALIVYGDTDSTLAGAVAAAKLHIPIAHIEAGLRSFNRRMPEEINRILTDHAATLLFAPTQLAVSHLAAEGIAGESVRLVGDVMFDAALHFGAKAESTSTVLDRLRLESKHYVLATVHRAENTDTPKRLRAIVDGLSESTLPVVLPLHPRTRSRLESNNITVAPQIKAIEPLGYLDMVMLEKNAALIATDSGGVQKEAFFHCVPCVTLREETEWRELVDSGWNSLVPPECAKTIANAIAQTLGSIGEQIEPYGQGDAAAKIARGLQTLVAS